MNVPKVNGQLGQESLHILVSAIPSGEAMDCKGVPQIMETGLVAGSIVVAALQLPGISGGMSLPQYIG